MSRRSAPRDRGSAVVDFVLVASLITLMFVALIQLAVVLHVRNVLIDCAVEGARYGALADRTPADGAQRTRELAASTLSDRYARDVQARLTVLEGASVVEVRVTAPLPAIGLVGTARTVSVTGHALVEGQ